MADTTQDAITLLNNGGQTVSSSDSQSSTAVGVVQSQTTSTNTTVSQAGSVAAYDPSASRLSMSGLVEGAAQSALAIAGQVLNINFGTTGGTIAAEADWRVRISMQPTTASMFYTNPTNTIMAALAETAGLIFPYTPSVTINHTARYNPQQLTHSNYNSYFYEGSEVQAITINGEFTIQSPAEGRYLMAAIHFMRACTKMFFGQSPLAGTPPPMVFLDGYGPAYLPHVPCVVTTFNHVMPADVDYINVPIDLGGGSVMTRLPTMSTLAITLQPIYSRNNIAKNFSLENFNAGALIRSGVSPTGGFL